MPLLPYEDLLVPLAFPVQCRSVTYACDRRAFLRASREAATQMTAYGTGWQVDGYTSTRLFLKRFIPEPESMGITPLVDFELSRLGHSVTVTLITRSISEMEIFQDFTSLVSQNLSHLLPSME